MAVTTNLASRCPARNLLDGDSIGNRRGSRTVCPRAVANAVRDSSDVGHDDCPVRRGRRALWSHPDWSGRWPASRHRILACLLDDLSQMARRGRPSCQRLTLAKQYEIKDSNRDVKSRGLR
jgi:hypothetical protein